MMMRTKRDLATVAIATLAFALSGCGDDSSGTTTTTTTALPATTTTGAVVTTARSGGTAPRATAPRSTAAPTSPAPTSAAKPTLGAGCALGSFADCIDPDGDGQGTYLSGGAACMQAFASSPELCSDLDGDGRAGYPDSG
jgi:hypothetical protein